MATPYDIKPWLRYYPAGVPAEAEFPDDPLTSVLDDAVARYPRRPALIFLGRRISYRELAAQVDRFADALRGLGVHHGDRVATVLPNCPQAVIAFFGTLRRGAVIVQNNPLYTAAELHAQLADSGATVVVVLRPGLRDARGRTAGHRGEERDRHLADRIPARGQAAGAAAPAAPGPGKAGRADR